MDHQFPHAWHIASDMVDTQSCSLECTHFIQIWRKNWGPSLWLGHTELSVASPCLRTQWFHTYYAFHPELLKGRLELSEALGLVGSMGSRFADDLDLSLTHRLIVLASKCLQSLRWIIYSLCQLSKLRSWASQGGSVLPGNIPGKGTLENAGPACHHTSLGGVLVW